MMRTSRFGRPHGDSLMTLQFCWATGYDAIKSVKWVFFSYFPPPSREVRHAVNRRFAAMLDAMRQSA
jgi:hypothetical protein